MNHPRSIVSNQVEQANSTTKWYPPPRETFFIEIKAIEEQYRSCISKGILMNIHVHRPISCYSDMDLRCLSISIWKRTGCFYYTGYISFLIHLSHTEKNFAPLYEHVHGKNEMTYAQTPSFHRHSELIVKYNIGLKAPSATGYVRTYILY